jgi:tetratricopeptide (TPR) repeat protein
MYQIQGDLPIAENHFREAVAIFTKLNRVDERDVVTKNLADLLQHRGEFREAKNILEPLLERVRTGGSKSVLGTTMQTLGSIAETQGDMTTALQMYQDAVARLKETGAKTDYTAAERSLGKALLREGDFASAKQYLSDALSVDRETGAKTDTAMDDVELAKLSLAQAGPVDTYELRSVIDQFRLQKITDGEIEAEIVFAGENIQQDKSSEAANIMRQASLLSAKSYDPTVRFDVALAIADVLAAQHDFAGARRAIRPALEKAVVVGCVRCQLEARLELGEIAVQAGNAELGRTQLRELADEARTRGFRLIAERAAADSR